MLPEYTLNNTLLFGKYKGKMIAFVVEVDPTYIEWAIDSIDNFQLDREATSAYDKSLDEHYANEDHYPSPHYSDW